MKVTVEITRRLDCYEPTTEQAEGHITATAAGSKLHYYKRNGDFLYGESFFHYPFVIEPDGSLWDEANRYLLQRLNGVVPVKHRTLESLAYDLAYFRQWMLDDDINYLDVPSRVHSRPTYRYCTFLHDEISFGHIKPGTAKRRMSTVQNFYRWLKHDGKQFNYPLWLENDTGLTYKDTRGFMRKKSLISTDLTRSFSAVRKSDEYSEHINDSGKLRPLPKEQQQALVESLIRIANTEMTLAFLFALTTGARLQTVFTLRRKHFIERPREGATAQRLNVGGGTLISTKYGRQMVLQIPVWLCRRFQIYMQSPRCLSRVSRSNHVYPDEDEQYLFLTRTGQPYYMADGDPSASLYRTPPHGNAVTQFIRQQLKPDLASHGHEFEFKFHDLRATFGMNLLEGKLVNYPYGNTPDSNKPEFFQVLMYVRERMGHSQLRTTEAYLTYRHKYYIAVNTQIEYEAFLQKLLGSEGSNDELG